MQYGKPHEAAWSGLRHQSVKKRVHIDPGILEDKNNLLLLTRSNISNVILQGGRNGGGRTEGVWEEGKRKENVAWRE